MVKLNKQKNVTVNGNITQTTINKVCWLENIYKMKSPHKMAISSCEKFGTIIDYTLYQEQRDLENYKRFINSSAYDDIKDVEEQMTYQKKLTLNMLRKRSMEHDD